MKIRIKNKKYVGQCNALSYIFYKKIFKVNIFVDLENLRKDLTKISENTANREDVEDFCEILIKLIYILIYTKNQDVEDFEEWKQDIKLEDLTEKITFSTIELYLESFVDEDVENELEKIPNNNNNEKNIFPEHEFLKICLDYGMSIQDLKTLTYIDITKIFICSYKENQKRNKKSFKEATQSDWDRLASM